MTITLGCRALSLLAFVAAATAMIVHAAPSGNVDVILGTLVAVSHP